MLKLSDIKKGYAAMNAGAWVGDIPIPLFDGIKLKVRRLWNPDYVALHDKLGEDKTDLSEADNDRRISDECLAETVLVGWEGVDDKFTVDTARVMLKDPDMGGVFRNAILWAASRVGDQVKADLEADTKNSPAP